MDFPKYIIFDTNCFIEAMRKSDDPHFDYERIKRDAKENGSLIVISAYTLYELIQGIDNYIEIEVFKDQLIRFGDFFVTDNHVLDHKGLEYGIDFLFILNLQDLSDIQKYYSIREEIKNKVYDSLFRRMFTYSSLVAASYVVLSECNADGNLNYDTFYKCNYILNHFWNKHLDRYSKLFNMRYEHVGQILSFDPKSNVIYKDYKASSYLRDYILNLIIEILSIANLELEIAKGEIDYNPNTYDSLIIDRINSLTGTISHKSFKKVHSKAVKLSNGKHNITSICNAILSGYPDDLTKGGYLFLIDRLFTSGGFGKSFNNDFIDFANMNLLDAFDKGKAVYLTCEKTWMCFLETKISNVNVSNSIEFRNMYQLKE